MPHQECILRLLLPGLVGVVLGVEEPPEAHLVGVSIWELGGGGGWWTY